MNKSKAASCQETLDFPGDARRPLERDELIEYRGAVEKLLWLASQTRPNLALGTSGRRRPTPTPCCFSSKGPSPMAPATSVFVLLAFANNEGRKSECGMIGLCDSANACADEDVSDVTPLWFARSSGSSRGTVTRGVAGEVLGIDCTPGIVIWLALVGFMAVAQGAEPRLLRGLHPWPSPYMLEPRCLCRRSASGARPMLQPGRPLSHDTMPLVLRGAARSNLAPTCNAYRQDVGGRV